MKTTIFLSIRPFISTTILTCLVLFFNQNVYADAWYNLAWNFRNTISVTNTVASPQTDIQVKITLNNTFDFTKAKSDGSDILIAASDGTTLIPFWIEKWNAGTQQATIWVKVPTVPVDGTTIFMYYGNTAATSVSNGTSTFRFFDDFESWNVNTGSSGWVTKAPQPTAIADQTSAVYNGKLYVFGGYGDGPEDPKNKNYVYDPAADSWVEKAPMLTPRWGMVAVEFNGLIYVFGGSNDASSGDIVKNEVYNPVSNTWTTKNNIPLGLGHQGVMGVKVGTKIHLFYDIYHYEYDPLTDDYTEKSPVPQGRNWSTCALVGSKIYLIGGNYFNLATNNNQVYDIATDSWDLEKAPLPVSLWGVTRENPVIDGKIYVTHGLDTYNFQTTTYRYDPATDTWESKGRAVHPRDGTACGVINNKLYVIGGRADFGGGPLPLDGPFGLLYNEVYDPSLDTWQPVGSALWNTPGNNFVFASPEATYTGNNGMVIRQINNVGEKLFAMTTLGFGDIYALDYDWNVTTAQNGFGPGTKPEVFVCLTEDLNMSGSVAIYNNFGTEVALPVLTWYNQTVDPNGYRFLQNTTFDAWHNVTVIKNGNDSRVAFDNTWYTSPTITSPPGGGTGKVSFGVYFATKQYIDNVRIRKWAGEDMSASVGNIQYQGSLSTTWTGAVSADWNDPLNWSTGVPLGYSQATIPSSPTNKPIITSSTSSPAVCENLTIQSGASLTINPTKALTINGTLTNSAGSDALLIKSDASGTGSLIHKTPNVPAKVERYVHGGWSSWDAGWHLISSPIADQAISAFTTTGGSDGYDFYLWYEVFNGWINFKESFSFNAINTNSNFQVGTGYLISYQQTQTGKFFSGNLNVNNITKNNLSLSSGANYSWHLLGNPFTSALRWNDGNWALNNISNTAKIWNEIGKSYSDISANDIIPSAQGFMVSASNSTNSITIPANARIHNNTQWYKSVKKEQIVLLAGEQDGNSFQESKIILNARSVPGFDFDYDAMFLPGYAPQFYSVNGEDLLSTNCIPSLDTESEFVFGFKKNESDHFRIELKESIEGFTIFLTDKVKDTTQNMSLQPVYNFTSSDSDDLNRFILHFKNVPSKKFQHDTFIISQSNGFINIQLDQPVINAEIVFVNMLGQVIQRGTINRSSSAEISSNNMVKNGVYIVTIALPDKILSEKVIISK